MTISNTCSWNLFNYIFISLIVLLPSQASQGDDAYAALSQEEKQNKLVIATAIIDVLNKGQFEKVDELFADELVEHDPYQTKTKSPKESFIAAVNVFRSAFPDGVMTIEKQIAEGDFVSTRWSKTGTHMGEFMGIPPTNRKITFTGIFFDRLENGKIVETWANYDLFGLLQQIRD